MYIKYLDLTLLYVNGNKLSNFRGFLTVLSLYLGQSTSAMDFDFGNRTPAKQKKTATATRINMLVINVKLLH